MKSFIRKKILYKIKKYSQQNSVKYRCKIEEEANKNLLSLCQIVSTLKIWGFYYPMSYEISPLPTLHILEKTKTVGLPILQPKKMVFSIWEQNMPMTRHPLGFMQPQYPSPPIFPDAVICPLVAFDASRTRLGYGYGWYDRYLAFLKSKKEVICIGFAYSFQEESYIPPEKHDIKMHYIVTEKKIFGL